MLVVGRQARAVRAEDEAVDTGADGRARRDQARVSRQDGRQAGPGLRGVVHADGGHREEGTQCRVGFSQRLGTELTRAGGLRFVTSPPGLAHRHEAGHQSQDEEHGGPGEGEAQSSDHASTGVGELDR